MADQDRLTLDAVEQIPLDEVGVLERPPRRRRRGGFPESGEVDEVHASGVLKQDGNAPETLPVPSPPVEEHQVAPGRQASDFGNEHASAVLKAFDGAGTV
jgi:hypothetical protein